jgi:hypothetical protein
MLGTCTERGFLLRRRGVPLKQKKEGVLAGLCFILFGMSRRRWKVRLLKGVLREGKRH